MWEEANAPSKAARRAIPGPSCSGCEGGAETCAGPRWGRGLGEGRGFVLLKEQRSPVGRSWSSACPQSGLRPCSFSSHFAPRPRCLQSWVSRQLAPGERAKLWGVEFRGPRLAEPFKFGLGSGGVQGRPRESALASFAYSCWPLGWS